MIQVDKHRRHRAETGLYDPTPTQEGYRYNHVAPWENVTPGPSLGETPSHNHNHGLHTHTHTGRKRFGLLRRPSLAFDGLGKGVPPGTSYNSSTNVLTPSPSPGFTPSPAPSPAHTHTPSTGQTIRPQGSPTLSTLASPGLTPVGTRTTGTSRTSLTTGTTGTTTTTSSTSSKERLKRLASAVKNKMAERPVSTDPRYSHLLRPSGASSGDADGHGHGERGRGGTGWEEGDWPVGGLVVARSGRGGIQGKLKVKEKAVKEKAVKEKAVKDKDKDRGNGKGKDKEKEKGKEREEEGVGREEDRVGSWRQGVLGGGMDASRPKNSPLSIDEIVRKHASREPSVFGLTRSQVESQGPVREADACSERSSRPEIVIEDTRPRRDSWESLKRRLNPVPTCTGDPSNISQYLKSRHLTRYVTLRRPAQAGQILSLAQVGDPVGYPVVVFLGLGCVRYLVALYDELAVSLGIRLICIDRWGLGRSHSVPPESRGLVEWAEVVREVMDQLKVETFGVIAHSAGAPFAMATALRLKERVVGTVHLLAPWVGGEMDGPYKWLKYVPSGVIKTAQATEWKLQGWRLGRPPVGPSEGFGYVVPSSFAQGSKGRIGGGYFVGAGDLRWERDETDGGAVDWGYSLEKEVTGANTSSPWTKVDSHPPVSPLVGKMGGLVRRASNRGLRAIQSTSNRLSATNSPYLATSDRSNTSTSSLGVDSVGSSVHPGDMSVFGKKRRSRQPVPRRTTSLLQEAELGLEGEPISRPGSVVSNRSSNRGLKGETSFATSLLQASHAEALEGGTADLLSILGRDCKPWGFSYTDIPHRTQVWLGDRDDKIMEKSVRWMEREMHDCQVQMTREKDIT